MRVLYISSANFWGGASVALFNVVNYMNRHGHETYVFTVAGEGRLIEELTKNGIRCYVSKWHYSLNIWPQTKNPFLFIISSLITILRNQFAQKELASIIRTYKPDLVHTNVGPLDIALRICQKNDIPHVWHIREYQDKDFNMHFMPSQKKFRRIIKSKCNYNISITKDIFDYWNLRHGLDRVVYDGVFSEFLLPVREVKAKESYILFVGRIEPAKSPLLLIRAYKELINRYSHFDIKLKLVGTINKGSEYQLACEKFIQDHNIGELVEFLDERKDVYELMSKAMCLVVPSQSEGFGFITVEAMLNHCPVIGRMTGGTKEQIIMGQKYENNPIAVPFVNESDLPEKIHYVLSSDNSDMVERAYHMVTTHYTNEICGREILRFYHDILNR